MAEKVAGIILCIIGLVLSVKPTLVWKLTESWKTKESNTPSYRYMTLLRILSGAFIGVGALLALGIIK